MAKVKEVIDLINGFAPEETQEKWDNSGWQINLGIEECSKHEKTGAIVVPVMLVASYSLIPGQVAPQQSPVTLRAAAQN